MRKGMATALAACGLAAVLAGCGGNGSEGKTVDMTPQQMAEVMLEKRNPEAPGMDALTDKQVAKLYGLEDGVLEAGVVYVCEDNMRCDELAVLQAKDGELDKVKEAAQLRLESKLASFKDYLPEEYAVLEQGEIWEKGNVVVFSAGENAADMLDALQEAIS